MASRTPSKHRVMIPRHMGQLWERIHNLHEDGRGLHVKSGPSLHQLEHSQYAPELGEQPPVWFNLEYGPNTITIRVKIRMTYRYDDDSWQLLGSLTSHYESRIPSERPTLDQATVFVGNYMSKTRTGSIQISQHLFERIEKGESYIA